MEFTCRTIYSCYETSCRLLQKTASGHVLSLSSIECADSLNLAGDLCYAMVSPRDEGTKLSVSVPKEAARSRCSQVGYGLGEFHHVRPHGDLGWGLPSVALADCKRRQ